MNPLQALAAAAWLGCATSASAQPGGIVIPDNVLIAADTLDELVCKLARERIDRLRKSGLPIRVFQCVQTASPLKLEAPQHKVGFNLRRDEKEKVQQFDYHIRLSDGKFLFRDLEIGSSEIKAAANNYEPLPSLMSYVVLVNLWPVKAPCVAPKESGGKDRLQESIESVRQIRLAWQSFSGWLPSADGEKTDATQALSEALEARLGGCAQS